MNHRIDKYPKAILDDLSANTRAKIIYYTFNKYESEFILAFITMYLLYFYAQLHLSLSGKFFKPSLLQTNIIVLRMLF